MPCLSQVGRSGQNLTAKKVKPNHGGGLFSGFFGKKEKKKKDQEEDKEPESDCFSLYFTAL